MDVYSVRTDNGRVYRVAIPQAEIIVDSDGDIFNVGTANRYVLVEDYGQGDTRPYWTAGTNVIYDASYTSTADRYSSIVSCEPSGEGSPDWAAIQPVLLFGAVLVLSVIGFQLGAVLGRRRRLGV